MARGIDRYKVAEIMEGWSKSLDTQITNIIEEKTSFIRVAVALNSLHRDIEKAILWEIRRLYPLRNFEMGFNLDGTKNEDN